MPVNVQGTVSQVVQLEPGLVEAHGDPLYINIRGFRWEMDGSKGSYAGVTAQAVTDDDTNYVYLNDSGALVVHTTGFPAATVTHIRLARVVAANGEITAIYEERALLVSGTGGGTDTDAIHKSVAAEISTVTEKGAPVAADLVLIEDSADSNNKKRVQLGNLPGSGGGWVIRCTMGGDDTGAAFMNDTDWEVIRSFRFPGTGVVTPSVFRIVASRAGTANQNDVRLYDFTNAQVIAELTVTAVGKAVYTDSSLQNLPASEAIWEVQAKKSQVQASLGYLHEFEVE